MIRVLIVDDHTIVRQGLKQILADTSDITVVAEASSGRNAIETVRETPCDVVLLDVNLPDQDGLSVMQVLKQNKPSLTVLVLSMYPEEQYAVRFLKNGASGYLTKESASDELIDAIRRVAGGGRYVSLSLAEALAFSLGPEAHQAPHELLSDREFQVMQMIGEGKTPTEIAQQLSLSVKTVSTYRTRILLKMDMQSSAEIMRYAIQHDLVN